MRCTPVARLSTTVGTRAVTRMSPAVPSTTAFSKPLFHTLSATFVGRTGALSQMRPAFVHARGLAKRDRRERMAASITASSPVRHPFILSDVT